MKFSIIYDSELDYHMCYRISIEAEEDYDMLSSIILPGDVIDFINMNKILVHNIEYNGNASIKIYGYVTNTYPENFDEFNGQIMKAFEIHGKCQFKIYRYKYFGQNSGNIYEQIESYKENKMKKKVISDIDIQNHCFEILNDYIAKKSNLVIFGKKALQLLQEDKLKVLMITYDIFKIQDNKMKCILGNENHKYKETNIVVYNEESAYYYELLNYGGIIGVINDK